MRRNDWMGRDGVRKKAYWVGIFTEGKEMRGGGGRARCAVVGGRQGEVRWWAMDTKLHWTMREMRMLSMAHQRGWMLYWAIHPVVRLRIFCFRFTHIRNSASTITRLRLSQSLLLPHPPTDTPKNNLHNS